MGKSEKISTKKNTKRVSWNVQHPLRNRRVALQEPRVARVAHSHRLGGRRKRHRVIRTGHAVNLPAIATVML